MIVCGGLFLFLWFFFFFFDLSNCVFGLTYR